MTYQTTTSWCRSADRLPLTSSSYCLIKTSQDLIFDWLSKHILHCRLVSYFCSCNLFSYPILTIQLTVSMLQLIVTNVARIYALSKLKGTRVLYFDQLVCTNRNLLLIHISKWNHLESKISTTNLHNH